MNLNAPDLAQVDPPGGLRSLLIPALIVIAGLAIAAVLFAHFGQTKPDASGAVLHQLAYPVQIDPGVATDQPGMAGQAVEQDETILLVQARVTNVSKKPLTVFDMVSNVTLNGSTHQSSAALPADIDQMFQRFPDLASMRMPLLTRHQIIQPGQSAQGLVVFSYQWSKQQWDQHKKADVVFSFENGRSLDLPLQ